MKKYVKSAIGSIADESDDARREIAKNPETDPQALSDLALDDDMWVRCNVASNPNTAPDMLDAMSYDASWQVRERVASNPNTPVEALEHLIDDENRSVQEMVIYNPNVTNEILAKYNTNIDSIVEEVTEYVTEALEHNLDDFLADLYDSIPDRVSRYSTDWWNSDSYFNPMDIVSHGDRRGAYETLEAMVKDIMFGNYGKENNQE